MINKCLLVVATVALVLCFQPAWCDEEDNVAPPPCDRKPIREPVYEEPKPIPAPKPEPDSSQNNSPYQLPFPEPIRCHHRHQPLPYPVPEPRCCHYRHPPISDPIPEPRCCRHRSLPWPHPNPDPGCHHHHSHRPLPLPLPHPIPEPRYCPHRPLPLPQPLPYPRPCCHHRHLPVPYPGPFPGHPIPHPMPPCPCGCHKPEVEYRIHDQPAPFHGEQVMISKEDILAKVGSEGLAKIWSMIRRCGHAVRHAGEILIDGSNKHACGHTYAGESSEPKIGCPCERPRISETRRITLPITYLPPSYISELPPGLHAPDCGCGCQTKPTW